MKKVLTSILILMLWMSTVQICNAEAVSGEEFVNFARENCIGVKYVSGGRNKSGFDCCGLVWYVCNHFGINVGNGNQNSQRQYGTAVSYSKNSYNDFVANLQMGDLIFFDYENDGKSNHVGIYSGNGKIIQAHRPGVNSQEDNLNGIWLDGKKEWQLTCDVRRVISNSKNSQADTSVGNSSSEGVSSPNKNIQYGDKGTAVRELQTSLNKIMNAGLDVDGNFGPKTLAAVKAFQQKYGLVVDGIAGAKTNAKINELLSHTHTYKNHYETAHPHKRYKLCECGDKVYVEGGKIDSGCEICYPPHQHSYTTKYEEAHPHKEVKSCSGCGAVEYTGNTKKLEDCEKCHEHSFEIFTESEHPHYEYRVCEECEYSEYTGEIGEDEDCEECYPCEHDYSKKIRSTHPHEVYYKCRECGETLETDETQPNDDCEKCYPEEEIESSGKRTLKLQIGVPQMYINGVSTEIDPGRGTVPIMQNDRTLLPIRAIVETFGAYVIWDEEEEKVTVISDDVTIQLWINQQVAFVNGEIRELDVAPVTINSRTFMPLRFIAENLGLKVGWNEANQTVTVEGEI